MSKLNQDILFNKRELKRLLKQDYLYLTFDSSVVAWKKHPYFLPSENGLWICSNPGAGTNKISAISGIENPQIHLYSIEKLLEIVPNSEQKE